MVLSVTVEVVSSFTAGHPPQAHIIGTIKGPVRRGKAQNLEYGSNKKSDACHHGHTGRSEKSSHVSQIQLINEVTPFCPQTNNTTPREVK